MWDTHTHIHTHTQTHTHTHTVEYYLEEGTEKKNFLSFHQTYPIKFNLPNDSFLKKESRAYLLELQTNKEKLASTSCLSKCSTLGLRQDVFKILSISISQFSHLVVSNSLRPHEPQLARPPFPSATPGVHPNSSPLSRWCHPTISSCRPLLLLPSILPNIIWLFSNESALHIRWPKYWCFSFSISPSNKHPGLISFRMDWLDILAVQVTLKSLLQHYSSKASILWHSAFLIVQHSHPYMTTGKTIALTRWTFVDKVMSLLFNMLSRLVIAFLPRSNLISWLQSPSAVILEPPKIKSLTVSHLFAWSDGTGCHDLSFLNVEL